ncbi:hypothetical protein KCV05_g250, partial [Aureobasidium melanogenum]
MVGRDLLARSQKAPEIARHQQFQQLLQHPFRSVLDVMSFEYLVMCLQIDQHLTFNQSGNLFLRALQSNVLTTVLPTPVLAPQDKLCVLFEYYNNINATDDPAKLVGQAPVFGVSIGAVGRPLRETHCRSDKAYFEL